MYVISGPGPVDPPMTSNVATRSLDVVWDIPFPPNGIITEYRIYQNDQLKETVRYLLELIIILHI